MSKVLERIVHIQVHKHLEKYKLLSEAQFGFRKHHSTATCILRMTDIVYRNMDSGLTGVVFLDLKKAFDTDDYEILLKKLRAFNLSVVFISWFKEYLTCRYQSVKCLGIESKPLPVKCGVPQGSILGLLLFIMYINDLEEYLEESGQLVC